MTTKSLTLSSLLAKHWQLPNTFETELDKLASVNSRPQAGLAAVVWRANVISRFLCCIKQGNCLLKYWQFTAAS